jgi:preprotein translocase subunit SecA
VYLRAYSQKNPLLEYKLEGFQIFDEMLMGIKTDIARTVFRVRIEREPARGPAAPRAVPVQAVHGSFGQFGAAGPTASTAVTARPAAPAAVHPVTVQRSVPKVGRNDPCPCGSGKKYKYCHGA